MLKPEDLHRLHDGELEPPALDPATLDAADRARLEAIDHVGSAVRQALLGTSEGVDLWPGVAQRIAAIDQAKRKTSTLRRWRDRARRRLRYVVPAVAAVAAGFVVWLNLEPQVVRNGCDIELLDVSGVNATVLKVPDNDGKGFTTVIWMMEE